jgi:hypothetical protein
MRLFLRALAALAFVATGSGAACSILVASEFSGYSLAPDAGDDSAVDTGVCTPPSQAVTNCGQCVAASCQQFVNAVCGNTSEIENLGNCTNDPSPTTGTPSYSCAAFINDAGLGNGVPPPVFNLRQCTFDNCQTGCTECTDFYGFDASTPVASTCASCIASKCKAQFLDGRNGCCNDDTVQQWLTDCFDPNHPRCSSIATAYPFDGGGFYSQCQSAFGSCVYSNCIQGGSCQQ